MTIRSAVALLSTLATSTLIPGCSTANESLRSTDCTVARIAERAMALRYPDFDSINNPPVVHDRGTTWEVEYELPKGKIGGTPVVVIDKTTMKVLRSFNTQ
jgi:hypothetical protein